MRDIDRPQRGEPSHSGDANVHSHFQRRRFDGQAAADFTTVSFDLLEVTEALHCRAARVIWPHSLLDVISRSHFNMEAQFRLNFTGKTIGMPAGVNETKSSFDPRHDQYSPQTARSAFMVALANRSQFSSSMINCLRPARVSL